MWLETIDFQEYKNKILTLGVESAFVRDQINQRFGKNIKRLFGNLCGEKIELQLVAGKQVGTQRPRSRPASGAGKGTRSSPRAASPAPSPGGGSAQQGQPGGRGVPRTPDYTFENFVIGDNNSFAASASVAISNSPGTDYNPCLIYGGVGLGKTHLIQAIGNRVRTKFPHLKIIYVPAEHFVNEFIKSINNNRTTQFKNKYRLADILLIDDIHFFSGKEGTQEELFHTFNVLYDARKQMVFTCDRPVSEIPKFTERLRSRFSRGLSVDLQPPSFETRVAIINKKVEQNSSNVFFPAEVIDYVAQNITTNVRDLEAALTRLFAYSRLVDKEITLDIVKTQLRGMIADNNEINISIQHVQKVVSDYFNISFSDLIGKKRTKNISFPRQLAIHLVRNITYSSFTDIGLQFGGRDHTTIIHANNQIEEKARSDPAVEATVKNLTNLVFESRKER